MVAEELGRFRELSGPEPAGSVDPASFPGDRPRLLFVSARFLFPPDSGGRIRSAQVLRGMKGGRYEITLASPEPPGGRRRFAAELAAVCDRFVGWPESRVPRWRKAGLLLSGLPVSVASDRSTAGRRVVAAELARRPDVAVFDFPHAAVLANGEIAAPSVLFTHNLEAEILERHAAVASGPLGRAVWRSQARKMARFEREAIRRFREVVAVSERDAEGLRERFGARRTGVIPTGVDLDRFPFEPPGDAPRLCFLGAMDWHANLDAVGFFLEQVWDDVVREVPAASFRVIGRNPPSWLTARAHARGARWEVTGYVDEVLPHLRGGAGVVIPLRVAGGTRIKVFEAMAAGCPVVSTAIGVEGLPLEAGRHYLAADTPAELAAAAVALLRDATLRQRLARQARRFVEERFSYLHAAREFERICRRAEEGGRP